MSSPSLVGCSREGCWIFLLLPLLSLEMMQKGCREDDLESVTCNERTILSPVWETVDSPWPKNKGKHVSISTALQVFSLQCLDKEMVMLLAGALRAVFVKLCQDSRYFVQMKVVSLFLGRSGSEKWVGKFESLA